MCGISAMFGPLASRSSIDRMTEVQHHRGPDATGSWQSPDGLICLGHNRLSIIDTRPAADQPMHDATGRYTIILNGEIYNYRELRNALTGYPFRTTSDTEVLLAAFAAWGSECFQKTIGMFACVIWDEREQVLTAVRDRFGVKPLYYAFMDDTIAFASEIRALHAIGVPREYDEHAWATWLVDGRQDHADRTFWKGVNLLPAGHYLEVIRREAQLHRWYNFEEQVGKDVDSRPDEVVWDEYHSVLRESVELRFRSDVPVGIALSGGLDSSILLSLVHSTQGDTSDVAAFTFTTGDSEYDELPWVRQMLSHTTHPLVEVRLLPEEVPDLATALMRHMDEPYGGIPTLAYSKLFAEARREGVVVLLDGQGMDEQWAGYDYYSRPLGGGVIQGTTTAPTRPQCLMKEFRDYHLPTMNDHCRWNDRLRSMQYQDLFHNKLPRALRYNDRISMRSGTELREPFLDHRLVATAFRQPASRKISDNQGKAFLRSMTSEMLPHGFTSAPKRPVQTPQREWLRSSLRDWAIDNIHTGMRAHVGWLDGDAVEAELSRFMRGEGDNSYFIWQWITLGLIASQSVLTHQTWSAKCH